MKVVRILNIAHYDARKQRFTSLAFKNSSSGGISVVSKACIQEQERTVCQHIEHFYPPPTSSIPPIFWEFNEQQLPTGYSLAQETSPSGDICHYNIEGVADKSAREMLLQVKLSDLQICELGQARQLTLTDLA